MSRVLRLTVISFMLLSAVALGVFLHSMKSPEIVRAEAAPVIIAPQPEVGYLVAAHALPAGTLARDDDFKVAHATTLPEDAIPDTADARMGLRGSLIRQYLDPGKTIVLADVLRPRDRGFVASVLTAGTRAVGVGVDAVSGVAGLIWPGDHVDVILTQDIDNTSLAHHTLSETILQNVRVIGIDQEIAQGASGANPAVGKLAHTVTLEVTPEQAEKIAVASHLGKMTLAIRAAVDQNANVASKTTYGSDVSPALAHSDNTSASVVVIEGNTRKEVKFP